MAIINNATAEPFLDLNSSERKLMFQQLHDAAQIGDITAVKCIFETHHPQQLPIDITRRGGNTTLHTALCHNQEGLLIDYLIQMGADVNKMNSKGYCPLTLAIIHCRGSNRAVQKLIEAGAIWKNFHSGLFENQSAMDVAIQHNNESVVEYLTWLIEEHKKEETLDNPSQQQVVVATRDKKMGDTKTTKAGHAICPICNMLVKFPTKMSRILSDQTAIEQRTKVNGERGGGGGEGGKQKQQRKYIARKYMDQLLQHSNGEAYKALCGIEYHGVENMRLRKEISESYAVLHAVQECCIGLGILESSTAEGKNGGDLRFENIFLIDLCSGKGITTGLCGVLDPGRDSNNYYLAIDKMLPHTIPHFLNGDRIEYRRRDILVDAMFDEIGNIVQEQSVHYGRTCILVGMHLCGLLSERAVDLFDRTPGIMGIVLSPCCLPKRHEQHRINFVKGKSEDQMQSDELFSYFRWANYLKERVAQCNSSGECVPPQVRLYTDDEMHTEKNAMIVAYKLSK